MGKPGGLVWDLSLRTRGGTRGGVTGHVTSREEPYMGGDPDKKCGRRWNMEKTSLDCPGVTCDYTRGAIVK